LIDGFIRLMESPRDVTGPINIGNPGEFTIRQLAEQVIDLTGSKSELIEKPLPQDDPLQRLPDIRQAEEVLGWKPSVAIQEGLTKTIQYFDEILKSNSLP
ncbi:MAG: SDR family NAD-dependent epimerase/dehydratase, partial [Pseudomonadota bacterium]